jgi:hypothetical protein
MYLCLLFHYVTIKTVNIFLKCMYLRISNKYGSLTRNKFLMKNVTILKYHDVLLKDA